MKPERMRKNLDLTDGLIMGEPVMLALGAKIGRQEAHDVVYDAAQAAATGDQSFLALLQADERVSSRLSPEDIKTLLDPMAYVGQAPEMARRAAMVGRAKAAALQSSVF